MIVVPIVVILIAIGAVVFIVTTKKKSGDASNAADRPAPTSRPAPAPRAPNAGEKSGRPGATVPPSARDRVRDTKNAPARPVPAGEPTQAVSPAPAAHHAEIEPDLSRFGGAAAPKAEPSTPAPASDSTDRAFRYPMEAALDDLVAAPAPTPPADPAPTDSLESFAAAVSAPTIADDDAPAPDLEGEPVEGPTLTVAADLVPEPAEDTGPVVATGEPEPLTAQASEPEPAFDLDRVLVAPLFGVWSDDDTDESVPDGAGATVTRLEPRSEPAEAPLAEIVADLIDAADPEVAEVMARLIDSSDPDLVARLVDADDLEVAEVVAKLLDAADDEVRSMVVDLADAPDRRQVAEVLRLVDAAYAGDDAGAGVLSPDIAEKLEDLDIESDLELTSRPSEMAQFARLENKDQLRVIIRVLCGLVGREDLPRSPRMPAVPASSAENRRWPLSRARWPVPPPDDEDIVKRAPLPARRADTKAS